MQQTYRRTPMSKCDFNKVAKQLYWNRILARVFCKFAVYFQNTFSEEHICRAASVKMKPAQTFVQLLKNISYMFLPLLLSFYHFYHYYREYRELIRGLFMILIKWKYNVICYFLGDDDYYSGAPKCTHLKELKTTSPS